MNKERLTKILNSPHLLLPSSPPPPIHQIIKPRTILQQEIHTRHDTKHPKAKNPHPHHRNDMRPLADKDAKDAHQRRHRIHHENRACELPRRHGRPKGALCAGDEDEPILCEGDLQEKDGVTVPMVFDDTLFTAEEGGEAEPCAACEDDPENNARAPQFRKIPFDGDFRKGGIIIGNHQGGDIGEDGDEDHVLEVEGFIEDGDPESKENLEVEGKRDTVHNVCVHSVEDLPAGFQGVDDGGETGCEEDNVGCGTSGV